MELSQGGAQGIDGCGSDEQEGGHQGKDTLQHQRHHGHHTAGDGEISQLHPRCMVQKRIHQAHGTDQGQHHPQLIKTGSHRNPRRLEQQNRIQHHHHQPGEIIFWKRYHRGNVANRHQQLAQRVQPVDRGILRRQGIHLPQLAAGLGQFIHRKSSFQKQSEAPNRHLR